MLNIDEILRIPHTKLLINLRGNKPLLLDKVIYTEHPAASKLEDSPVSDYNPEWLKNKPKIVVDKLKEPKVVEKKKVRVKEKFSWKVLES